MPLLDALSKAKLKPLASLLLLAGLVVVAYVALGMSILREHWDQDVLSSQIDLGAGVLVAVEDSRQDLEDLQARLRAAEQELALAESAFPIELDSSVVLETILAYADESQVRVLAVNIEPPTTEADEASAYSVLGFNFEVEGNLSQLFIFLAALESGALSASKTGAFLLQEEGGRYILDLEVLTYARSAADEASAPETPESLSGPAMETAGDGEEAQNE